MIKDDDLKCESCGKFADYYDSCGEVGLCKVCFQMLSNKNMYKRLNKMIISASCMCGKTIQKLEKRKNK